VRAALPDRAALGACEAHCSSSTKPAVSGGRLALWLTAPSDESEQRPAHATRAEPRLLLLKAGVSTGLELALATDETRASGQRPPDACSPMASRRIGRACPRSTVCGRRACRSLRGPCGDAGNKPCRRQGDQVVAPGSTRLLVEDDYGASGGTPILSSPMACRPASTARRPLAGAHARMDVPLEEGSAGPRSRRSRDVRALGARVRLGGHAGHHATAVVLAEDRVLSFSRRPSAREEPGARSGGPGEVDLVGRRARRTAPTVRR
jgi:hypothetical protein